MKQQDIMLREFKDTYDTMVAERASGDERAVAHATRNFHAIAEAFAKRIKVYKKSPARWRGYKAEHQFRCRAYVRVR